MIVLLTRLYTKGAILLNDQKRDSKMYLWYTGRMKANLRRETQCDFCHRLLNPNESLGDWQSYAVIDPSNVWYELFACPECKNSPKKRKESYSEQVVDEE